MEPLKVQQERIFLNLERLQRICQFYNDIPLSDIPFYSNFLIPDIAELD
jgi:hypothetical protein